MSASVTPQRHLEQIEETVPPYAQTNASEGNDHTLRWQVVIFAYQYDIANLFFLLWPGVPGEKQTLNATVAYFMGCGLAEQLAKRQGVSPKSLRVSVSAFFFEQPPL